MRQIFSIRFFAAVGAVAGLFFLLTTVFAARGVIDEAIDEDTEQQAAPAPRRIDLVEQIYGATDPGFRVGADGLAAGDTQLVIDPSRQVTVVAGTPGVDHCQRLDEVGACAIVADLLGEGVVWFALVPMGSGRTVALPAIDTLEGGVATLVNGWQLPHAPILDRRCGDEEFESYRQFKQVFGDQFSTVYDLGQRRLTAVVCRQTVPYAPPTESTTAPSPSAAVPGSTPPPSTPPP